MKRAHPNLTRPGRDMSGMSCPPRKTLTALPLASVFLFLLAGWLHNAPLAFVGALICALAVDWLSIVFIFKHKAAESSGN